MSIFQNRKKVLEPEWAFEVEQHPAAPEQEQPQQQEALMPTAAVTESEQTTPSKDTKLFLEYSTFSGKKDPSRRWVRATIFDLSDGTSYGLMGEFVRGLPDTLPTPCLADALIKFEKRQDHFEPKLNSIRAWSDTISDLVAPFKGFKLVND